MEQTVGMFSRLPSSDHDRYITELSRCRSTDIAAASPLVVFIIGSSYLLEKQLRVGPLRVPFYILIGAGTAAISTVLYKNSCAQRVRRRLDKEMRNQQEAAAQAMTESQVDME